MKESRRSHRMKIELPVSFEMGSPKSLVFAKTLDVSATGLSMKLNEPLEIGQALSLTIGLDNIRVVDLEAHVIWVKKKSVRGEHEVGLKIVDKMDRDEIDFVKFIAKKMVEHFSKEKPSQYDDVVVSDDNI